MSLQRIIWLASYPKSGNTWLRTVLANYFLGRRKAVSSDLVSQGEGH